jgi:hypothetical protein
MVDVFEQLFDKFWIGHSVTVSYAGPVHDAASVDKGAV